MHGIIVGSDQTLEWLLPWWIENYRKHNCYPVAFIDFGLSFEKKKWCSAHGDLIPLRMLDFADDVSMDLAKKWEEESGNQFWQARASWFKKPFALLKSPFDRTLWIDIDCEIRGSLAPLFHFDFAMAQDYAALSPYPIYNSGVVAFRKDHPLLAKWTDAALKKHRFFRGDQELFSHLIYEEKIQIDEIPPEYNWSRLQEENPNAIIQHWHGNHGKFVIRSFVEWRSRQL